MAVACQAINGSEQKMQMQTQLCKTTMATGTFPLYLHTLNNHENGTILLKHILCKCYLVGNSMESARNIAVKLQNSIATMINGIAEGAIEEIGSMTTIAYILIYA